MQHQTFAPETPRQIEARLETDRIALTASLRALGAKFTPDALWSSGVTLMKTNSAAYTQVLDRAIHANPLAVALTSVGLAWLILGRRVSPSTDGVPLPGTHVEAVARWEDEGGPVTENLTDVPSPDDSWIAEADQLRVRASDLIACIDAASRRAASPLAQLAVHRADVMAALTQDVRRIMAHGLDHLTDETRRQTLAARERRYEAHLQQPRTSTKPTRDSALATGAVFAAAGATLAALLPQSHAENAAFGAPRDQLVGSLRHALRDERARLAQTMARVAQSTLAEVASADPLAPPARHGT